MKAIIAILASLALSGCASSRLASDPKCEPVLKATALLTAANRFVAENHRRPESLAVLVPNYLAELPRDPVVEYLASESLLSFFYAGYAETFDYGCFCKAKLKQREFKCHCTT